MSFLEHMAGELRARRRQLNLDRSHKALLICDFASQHSSKKYRHLKEQWMLQHNAETFIHSAIMFVPSLLHSLWSYGVNINVMCIYIYTIVWHFVLNKFVDHVAAGILGVRTSSQGIVKKCKFQEDGERQVDPMMGSTSTGISFVEHTTAWLYVGDLHPVFASEWTNCTCPHRDRLQPGLG